MNHYDLSVETGRRHYYSSSQGPFYNANNIFMFYGGGERGQTVENVIRALRRGEGIQHVHGERGSGKTMLSLVISDRLKHRFNTIRYDIPEISASLLLRHLLIELLPQKADLISAQQAQEGAEQGAIDTALDGILQQLEQPQPATFKPFVLIIDSQAEADPETVRILEALCRVRVNDRAVLHCVMFHRVSEQAARSVNAHAASAQQDNHHWLRRLTLAEINEYLKHHMMLFDFNRRDLFTREMAYFIADRSEGVFRSINTLARNAFTIANLEDADKLSMSHLLMAGLPPRPEPSTRAGFLSRHRGQLVALLGTCVVGWATLAVILLK
ncbi:AAA family ATPase [Granulosicoccus sp. 3-233]|uniref:AAA family ATPase n=1 Tax=Granulosicoccus sp. 3-233 TaxID=3417969 RepID=UPI003D3537CF